MRFLLCLLFLLQSVQIEMLQEENYALVTMRNEEAQGHGNQKQKIQYTKRVKDVRGRQN